MKFTIISDVKSPERAHSNDSGIDFYIPNDFSKVLLPSERVIIPLGVKIILPEGYDLQLVDKSGISSKYGLKVLGGLIDNGYRGELAVCLVNTGYEPYTLSPGLKVVQGVIRRVEYFKPDFITNEEYNKYESDRGEGGFGSTGE